MRCFLCCCVVVLLCSAPCWAKPASLPKDIRITSDSLTYSQDKRSVTFTGHVHVARQDFEMWTKRLTVFLRRDQAGNQAKTGEHPASAMEKIIADGGVRLKNGERVATAEKVVYTAADETLRLTGNPFLREGKNELRGEVVVVRLKENTSEVLGGKKRVEAVFFPERNGSEPF